MYYVTTESSMKYLNCKQFDMWKYFRSQNNEKAEAREKWLPEDNFSFVWLIVEDDYLRIPTDKLMNKTFVAIRRLTADRQKDGIRRFEDGTAWIFTYIF